MKLASFLALLLTLVAALAVAGTAAADAKERVAPKELQIGVKHRPEVCTQRSRKGDRLSMHYRGTLFADGSEFDASYNRNQPFDFVLGAGQVIKGWDQGLLGMCVGEKRKLVIPPHLGYGAGGSPPVIPPAATLVFEVELLKILNSGSSHPEF
ncbi:Peptidyl-prolyl cis-trans isomerase fpr2 [Blastocladiella emersonii ATCC 22665]|nr:Peptidyl-prolyl cis-trans isomerase fpr2 [Blastocladiella emersonii ATCC 22665]